jgi:hypothetical protein
MLHGVARDPGEREAKIGAARYPAMSPVIERASRIWMGNAIGSGGPRTRFHAENAYLDADLN